MSKHTRVVDGAASIKATLDWVYSMLNKGLPGGAVGVDVYRYEEGRSLPQNAKQFAMYTDISKQVCWHGEWLQPEDWKDILSSDWAKQRIVPGIGGGFVALGVRTSKLKKREMAELLELIYAFGAEHNVKWSEPALACFAEYREAQQ